MGNIFKGRTGISRSQIVNPFPWPFTSIDMDNRGWSLILGSLIIHHIILTPHPHRRCNSDFLLYLSSCAPHSWTKSGMVNGVTNVYACNLGRNGCILFECRYRQLSANYELQKHIHSISFQRSINPL